MSASMWGTSYEQYKEDTNFVASCLEETATRFGFHASDVPRAATTGPQRRGGNGTKAKQDASAVQSSEVRDRAHHHKRGTPQGTRTVPLKNFVPMAKYIAALEGPDATLPSSFFQALDRTISLRKIFSEHKTIGSNSSATRFAARQHEHFVRVLEDVREALKLRRPPETLDVGTFTPISAGLTPKAQSTPSSTSREEEMTSSTSETREDDDMSRLSGSMQAMYEAEQPDDLEEALLDFSHFLHDLRHIRKFILNMWLDFQKGTCHLISASIASNAAFELVRHLESRMDVVRKYGGSDRMLYVLYTADCMLRGTPLPDGVGPLSHDHLFETYDVAEEYYIPTRELLEALKETFESETIMAYKPGHWGTYDPTFDRLKMTPKEKFAADKVLLSELLSQFSVLAILNDRHPSDDEFVRGMSEVFAGGRTTASLIFSTQLYLDIHHQLGKDVILAFDALKETSRSMFNSIRESNKIRAKFDSLQLPVMFGEDIDDISNYILSDIAKDRIKDTVCLHSQAYGSLFEQHYFYKHYPIRCGLSAAYIRNRFSNVSIALATISGSVISVLHLYNAVRQEEFLNIALEQLEHVLRIQKERDIFGGKIPTTAEGYIRTFCLASGLDIGNHIPSMKKKAVKATCALKLNADTEYTLFWRYFEGKNDTAVDKAGHRSKKNGGSSRGAITNKSPAIKHAQDRTTIVSALTDILPSSKDKTFHETLQSLRLALETEIPAMRLDYLSLHWKCWQFLHDIKKRNHLEMCQVFGSSYIHEEAQLPYVVGYILAHFYTERKEKQELQSGSEGPNLHGTSTPILQRIATLFNEL